MSSYENISIKIINILEGGKCSIGHQIGDNFNFEKERGTICPHAMNVIFPYIVGLQSGGSFPWEKDPNSISVCCPDPNNPVVFKITRKK